MGNCRICRLDKNWRERHLKEFLERVMREEKQYVKICSILWEYTFFGSRKTPCRTTFWVHRSKHLGLEPMGKKKES